MERKFTDMCIAILDNTHSYTTGSSPAFMKVRLSIGSSKESSPIIKWIRISDGTRLVRKLA